MLFTRGRVVGTLLFVASALAEGVRTAAPRLEPLYRRLSRGLQALEMRAGT